METSLTFSEWVHRYGGNPQLCQKHALEFRRCLRECGFRFPGGFGPRSFLDRKEFMAVYRATMDNPEKWTGLRELFNFVKR